MCISLELCCNTSSIQTSTSIKKTGRGVVRSVPCIRNHLFFLETLVRRASLLPLPFKRVGAKHGPAKQIAVWADLFLLECSFPFVRMLPPECFEVEQILAIVLLVPLPLRCTVGTAVNACCCCCCCCRFEDRCIFRKGCRRYLREPRLRSVEGSPGSLGESEGDAG